LNKADIFHGITERNALRKAAQMPLLDVRREFERLVALKALDEYYALRDAQYADDEKRILQTVWDDYRARKPDWGHTSLGVLAVRLDAERRFQAFLERRGIYKPYIEPMCVYGSHKKEV
jgi:hypothetical protein